MGFWDALADELFGPDSTAAGIAAATIFVLLGAMINFYIEVRRRDIESPSTPTEFSLKFLFHDNAWRLFGTIIMCFTFVCMGPSLILWLSEFMHIPNALAHFSPFFLGLAGDYVPMLLKQKLYKQQLPVRIQINQNNALEDATSPLGDN